jgi:hypothetical protein
VTTITTTIKAILPIKVMMMMTTIQIQTVRTTKVCGDTQKQRQERPIHSQQQQQYTPVMASLAAAVHGTSQDASWWR